MSQPQMKVQDFKKLPTFWHQPMPLQTWRPIPGTITNCRNNEPKQHLPLEMFYQRRSVLAKQPFVRSLKTLMTCSNN